MTTRKGLSLTANGRRSSQTSPWRNYPSAVLTSGKFAHEREKPTSWWQKFSSGPRDGSFYAEALTKHPESKLSDGISVTPH